MTRATWICLAAVMLSACNKGTVTGGDVDDDACSADVPQGTCPSGQTCTNGACVPIGADDTADCTVTCGGSCPPCDIGTTCNTGSECVSGVCNATCQAPTCTDGVQNNDETGVDCGGSCTAEGHPCSTGSTCTTETDCASLICNVTCQAATCTDSIKNGTETGVDCGGDCVAEGHACDVGETCTIGTDCTSAVCNSTCQAPSCTDGSQNQDEHGIDCGGTCLTSGLTCPAGAPCDAPTECTSGFCSGQCQASSCVPPDGIKNGSETGVDCGGPDCPGCPIDGGCTVDTDCASDYCGSGNTCEIVSCGDGIKAANEDCDTSDFGGLTCQSFSFTGGSLACTGACALSLANCTGGCGNGTRDGTEQCDGADLGGATCVSQGYSAGALSCTGACAIDVAGCTSTACPGSCPSGGYCSASTGFLCTCPLYESACNGGCISLKNDPDNCGSCGHVCSGAEACSSGQCETFCTPPLVKCGRRCIDPQTDNNYCGADSTCASSTDCIAAYDPDRVCLSGSCVSAANEKDYTGAGDAPTRCLGGGPPLDINTGLGCDPSTPDDPDCVVSPTLGCTGDLAQVTFRYALCSCSDINTSHPLFADGFDSGTSPYLPHCENDVTCSVPGSDNGQCTSDANGDGHTTCADDKGAGIGANGVFSNSQLTTVWGSLWLSSGDAASYPDQRLPSTTVEQELHIGNTLSGGTVRVRENGYVAHNVTATGAFDGTLYQSAGTTSTMSAASYNRTGTLAVAEACDCSTDKLIDVPAIVDAHACEPQGTSGCSGAACCATSNNNNTAIGLDPTLLDNISTDVRVDLPCGNYDFTNIAAGNNTTVSIVVHGRTAIYVNSNMNIPKILNVTLSESAELDVFVKGGVCNNDTIYVGSPAYPARVRFYVGGGDLLSGGSGVTCANNSNRAMALKSIVGAANLYAPYGEVYMPQTFTLYGSIFAGRANVVQTATLHFDTGISSAGDTCEHCGDGAVDAGEECDGAALGGKTCDELGYSGGVLKCGSSCTYDTTGCCGDGVRGGTEQCDGVDLNGTTCTSLGQTGTISCSAACTFEGCTAACNPNGTIETANGEQCDPGAVASDPDVFPGARDTCTEVLGITATGTLTCNSNCQIDSSACTYCGDGLVNGSETCDGKDFDVAAGVQTTPPACTTGTGAVTCSSSCALDTSGCAGCSDCRDCNNQACVSGTCGACTDSSQCCAPLVCLAGTCTLF